jgi:hypothetical protein
MSAGTIDGTVPPRASGPDRGADDAETPAPRRRWLRLAALITGMAATAALLAASLLAARYQPVGFGGGFRGPLGPHLVSRQVNQTGGMRGQSYLPPQPQAHGSFLTSLENTGPLPVTIESVRLLPPGLPASSINYGRPLRIAGQPTYTLEDIRHGEPVPGPRPLAGAVLSPGESIYVSVPFVTARCWLPHSGTSVTGVWVSYRFMFFSRHVLIGWTDPGDPSQGAIIGAEGYASPHAAPGLICPR